MALWCGGTVGIGFEQRSLSSHWHGRARVASTASTGVVEHGASVWRWRWRAVAVASSSALSGLAVAALWALSGSSGRGVGIVGVDCGAQWRSSTGVAVAALVARRISGAQSGALHQQLSSALSALVTVQLRRGGGVVRRSSTWRAHSWLGASRSRSSHWGSSVAALWRCRRGGVEYVEQAAFSGIRRAWRWGSVDRGRRIGVDRGIRSGAVVAVVAVVVLVSCHGISVDCGSSLVVAARRRRRARRRCRRRLASHRSLSSALGVEQLSHRSCSWGWSSQQHRRRRGARRWRRRRRRRGCRWRWGSAGRCRGARRALGAAARRAAVSGDCGAAVVVIVITLVAFDCSSSVNGRVASASGLRRRAVGALGDELSSSRWFSSSALALGAGARRRCRQVGLRGTRVSSGLSVDSRRGSLSWLALAAAAGRWSLVAGRWGSSASALSLSLSRRALCASVCARSVARRSLALALARPRAARSSLAAARCARCGWSLSLRLLALAAAVRARG